MDPEIKLHVGVDTGGTFTDVVEIGSDGTVRFDKVFSTPQAPQDGILDAVKRAADHRSFPIAEYLACTERFAHGTTISTNALIQRRGATVGLLTTAGFEDTLEIARGPVGRAGGLPQSRAMDFLHTEPPLPLVPRHMIRGIQERIGAGGDVIGALDEKDVRAHLAALLEAGAESLAICFLWSFKNDAHERQVREIARELAPSMPISLSCEIAPRMGEFERMITTVVNAFVGPVTERYIGSLQDSLSADGLRRPVQIMKSSGGVALPASVARESISIINSGPIGGLVAAREFGKILGIDKIITADMGGTSFDVGLIADGAFEEQNTPFLDQGLPVSIPSIKVVTIGAGGGSIASSDGYRIAVGPLSAGADPGPACYDRGGTQPTVTDSLVHIGIIDPDNFFGGRYRLSARLAADAIDRHVARPLGLSTNDAAAGIYEIVTARMADLIRKVTVESGRDPREFCLLAYGGATAAHCAVFARQLGIRRVVIPYAGPVFSAMGVVMSDVLYSHSRSAPLPLDDNEATIEAMNEVLQALREQTNEAILAAGEEIADDLLVSYRIDMRYSGQMNEISLPWPAGKITSKQIPAIREAFEAYYQKRFGAGTVRRQTPLEIISFRIDAIKPADKHPIAKLFGEHADGPPTPSGNRRVYQHRSGWLDASTFAFEQLRAGQRVEGPAVLERNNTTVWVPVGAVATLDVYGNLEIDPGGEQ